MPKQKTLIIHPALKNSESHLRTEESMLEEAKGLALAIDLNIIRAQIIYLSRITPATHIGGGKADELAEFVKQNEIELTIMNTDITPVQQRNLEKRLGCKVIDRTALILEIFGERANTKEGKLQVELAAYEYQKSRLVRSWTHLERQRGGGGFLGGPGETQIESDRRAIAERIDHIKRQLKKVVKTRELHRKSRQKIPYEIVSLVGYTNAGKSTLFNYLTHSDVVAQDKLFATLDPTMRLMRLPSGKKVILSDTVGFISQLPTQLVAAFRATLEEVVSADLILHIRDIAHTDTEAQKVDVLQVMRELGVEDKIENNSIEVYNKIDLLDGDETEELYTSAKTMRNVAAISAHTGFGCDYLLKLIENKLSEKNIRSTIKVSMSDGQILAWLHAHAEIISQEEHDEEYYITMSISEKNLGKLRSMGRETLQ